VARWLNSYKLRTTNHYFQNNLIFAKVRFRYIIVWRELNEYYEIETKPVKFAKKLMKKGNINEISSEGIINFFDDLSFVVNDISTKIKSITQYKKYDSLEDFFNINSDLFQPLTDIINKHKLEATAATGLTLGLIIVLNRIRMIPEVELKNYNRIKYLLLLVVSFFVLYTVEYLFD